ncbi:MAG: hypothetical protein GKS06_06145 [Acidobacteria bacterium]|nr:hypothetical protein [Acidobacteriota bacterium]
MTISPRFGRLAPVAVLALFASASIVSAQSRAVPDGAFTRFDLSSFKKIDSLDGTTAGGEFGTQVTEGFLVTAPAAPDGGELSFVSGTEIDDSMTAADLAVPVERLGESWGDLGHPPGTSSALVIGAPSQPTTAARAVRPAAVIVEYGSPNRFISEVRRVSGTPGSLFGWRVWATDSQAPAASYNGSFFVTAPLETKGKRDPAGAVYKFETDTGEQLWKFKGQRDGEFAGYAIQPVFDRDGDGFNDLYVGAPGSSSGPAGRVYLISGRTGKVLDTLESPEGAQLFGYALASSSVNPALGGLVVGAPGTDQGKKTAAGAVYAFPDFDSAPTVFKGRAREQRFGIALVVGPENIYVGSREGHKKAKKDARGGVTVLLPTGKKVKFLRGKRGGEHFGRALVLALGRALVVGSPGAPPLFDPE